MKFPSIGQYLDSIRSGRDFFRTLRGVVLCHDTHGEPIYRSGNFGVVFKVLMDDRARSADSGGAPSSDNHTQPSTNEPPRALKCFTRPQLGREDAYRLISAGLPRSQYLVRCRFIEGEILATWGEGQFDRYSVLDMEWIEGQTLWEAATRACLAADRPRLEDLSGKFDRMAAWLLGEDFAHGDLKPENIIVGQDGGLKLIDYDDVFVPAMEGSAQRSLGTEQYNHPQRARAIIAFRPLPSHHIGYTAPARPKGVAV